jgi:RHS repeat-associated protein
MILEPMAVTKRVTQISMGPFQRDPSCSSDPTLGIAIYEYLDGAQSANDTSYVGESASAVAVTTAPRVLTWQLRAPITLSGGHSYTIQTTWGGSSCMNLALTQWQHGSPVNFGPYPANTTNCPFGPGIGSSNSRVGTLIYNGPGGGGYSCGNPTPISADTTMQQGWEAIVNGHLEWFASLNSPSQSACQEYSYGGRPYYWRPDPNNVGYSDYNCEFASYQYGGPGAQLSGGWFYSYPWPQDYYSYPQDIYLSVDNGSGPTPPTFYGGWNPAVPSVPRACAGDPVDCASGNLWESHSDLSIPFHGLKLEVARTYNSQAGAAGAKGVFGYGWSSLLDAHLVVDQTHGIATVSNANGSQVVFGINADGSFSPPGPWVQATLVQVSGGGYLYTLPDRSSLSFDSTGRLLSEADRNGNQITATYDGSGHLTALTDGTGRSITLSYNPDGTISSAQDYAGDTVTYSYGNGNLTAVREPDKALWQFAYDGSHQMNSQTDPDNNTTTTLYDSSNRVMSQTDALHRTRTWSYSQWAPGENETTITNPGGDITDEQFDFSGEPLRITHAQGTSQAVTRSYTYTDNLPVSLTDENGHTTSWTYNAAGDRASQTDPNNHATSWGHDAQHDLTSIITPSGHTTTITYDTNGNPTQVSRTLTETGQTQSTSYTYDGTGDQTSSTDPLNHTSHLTYDPEGELLTSTDPNNDQTTYTYDQLGRVATMVTPAGNVTGADPTSYTTTYAYDSAGRLLSETDPLHHTQSFTYDAAGNLATATDANNNTSTSTYDADNELTKVTRADGSTEQAAYDADGQVIRQTNGANHTTTYTRNNLEQVTQSSDPLNRTTTYGYDPAGQLTNLTDPLNRTTSYGYDPAGQLTSIAYSDGHTPNVSYSYNPDGQRTAMTDGTGNTSYTYDSLGRLTGTTDGNNDHLSYGYDLADQQTSITYPNGKTITQAFDPAGQLTSITDWLTNTTSFAYDSNSNVTTTTFPQASSNVDRYGYNRADQLTQITNSQGASTLASAAYARDPVGQISSATVSGTLPASTTNYTYDQLERLTAAGALSNTYDTADNATQLQSISGYTYDAANELTSISPQGLTAVTSYTYDPPGERTAQTIAGQTVASYNYDQAGSLTSYQKPGIPSGTTDTYSYNGDGLLAGRNTSHFTWDISSSLPLLIDTGQASIIYGPDQLPLEQIDHSGNILYYHHDQQGSTTLLTNGTGALVGSATYTPWGTPTWNQASTNTATTPLAYDGQYTDPDSGLIYLRARWYDPATAQFLVRDPLEALSQEAYTYALDNPLNGSDPTGEYAIPVPGQACPGGRLKELLGAVAGAIAAAAAECIATGRCDTSFRNGRFHNKRSWHHIVARTARLAAFGRLVLENVDIGINDSRNLADVSTPFHWFVHTAAYYLAVNALLDYADPRARQGISAQGDVTNALAWIRSYLQQDDPIRPFPVV